MKNKRVGIKNLIIILVHGFVGWLLCGAIMGVGLNTTSETNTLIIHAVGAPIIFIFISWIYFKKFNFTSPLITAFAFLLFIGLMDLIVVSLLIKKNLDMFKSILGTWTPLVLIFLSTYFTGYFVRKPPPLNS